MEGIPIYSASIRPIQYHVRGLYALLQDPVKPRRGESSTACLAGWTGGGGVPAGYGFPRGSFPSGGIRGLVSRCLSLARKYAAIGRAENASRSANRISKGIKRNLDSCSPLSRFRPHM